MIKLLVDEAYAFDYLAILYHKKDFSKINYEKYQNCESFLKDQFDTNEWERITHSNEFQELILINKELFHYVNLAKTNLIPAKQLDDKNMERFYCKQNFQKNLFPEKPFGEIKIV